MESSGGAGEYEEPSVCGALISVFSFGCYSYKGFPIRNILQRTAPYRCSPLLVNVYIERLLGEHSFPLRK